MKILVDTNIVLDVLLKRSPYYPDSFAIFQLIDMGRVIGCLSSTAMTDIFYLLRKDRFNSVETYQIMDEINALFTIIPVTDNTISKALKLRWRDFEDAVQYTAAEENEVEYIITRNEADYKTSAIKCMSPSEFFSSLGHTT
jgi:predicted nucleic acid-binding protein